MTEIIEIFKMEEISIDVRISVIKKLGNALNNQYGMNWTEEVIEELVKILESKKAIS